MNRREGERGRVDEYEYFVWTPRTVPSRIE
jgi:hypothetical protein